MRTILLGICICFSLMAVAQRECGTAAYSELQQTIDPTYHNRILQVEQSLAQQQSTRLMGEGASVIRIPIVVHVLYANAGQNISDAQIATQIDALNRDFRKRNSDTLNTPERFKSLAADAQIEFFLAKTDPTGRPTTGIVRKATTVAEWRADDAIKFATKGGDNAWDSRYYLNIWVGNLRNLAGYATAPGSDAAKDGLVIRYNLFGTINTVPPFDKGRTVVHEVGHWLGLRHIWGDTYCGDDGIDDTPKQGNFTAGCPTGVRSSCSNGASGDMYMNFMDYTNDACLSLFTHGQKDRMHALFAEGGPRNTLLSSKGLHEPWNHNPVEIVEAAPLEKTESTKLYPNPANHEVTMELHESWIGQRLVLYDAQGQPVLQVLITRAVQKVSVASLKSGVYFLQGNNGSTKLKLKLAKL